MVVQAAAKQSDFVAQLEAANLHPLWDRFRTLTPVKPQAKDPPLIWRWRDIEPFTTRAVSEVPIDDVATALKRMESRQVFGKIIVYF